MARQYIIGGPLGAGFVIDDEDRDFSLREAYVAAASVAAGEPIADAWNVNDKDASIALSNGDKTATGSDGGAVRSTTVVSNGEAGKYYAELYLDDIGGGMHFGIQDTSYERNDSIAAFRLANDGEIYCFDTYATTISAFSNSDVMCVAWDTGAELLWFRRNDEDWNDSGTANPATGTGGIDVSDAASVEHALKAYLSTGTVVTLRVELNDFSETVPSGFSSWMGETPTPLGRAKVWTGSAWELKPVKVWSGSAWVEKPLKIWNGSAWV